MGQLRVAELWRYPVKSMGGERRDRLDVAADGPVGDRRWAVYDAERRIGSGKNTRRFRRMDGLLDLRAAIVDDRPLITAAGEPVSDIAAALDRPDVYLAEESDIPHRDAAAVHLITTAGLRWLQELLPESEIDPRRFRPNVVVDAPGMRPAEHDWIGRDLTIGAAQLRVVDPTDRCRMVGAPQPDLDDDNRVLKALGVYSDLLFGVYAEVIEAGVITVGDDVSIS